MNRRLQLINWVRLQHEGQIIKETKLPYFEHVLEVANLAADAAPLTYEIGLCHDLLEKTNQTATQLQAALRSFGYEVLEADHISYCVTELTKHFTKAHNPLPKKERKALEEERLLTISADAQTVKYADISYNASWMLQHDRHHAKDYLQHMIAFISELGEGDPTLRQTTLDRLTVYLKLT